jgi:hypothetical protein
MKPTKKPTQYAIDKEVIEKLIKKSGMSPMDWYRSVEAATGYTPTAQWAYMNRGAQVNGSFLLALAAHLGEPIMRLVRPIK